MDRATRIGDVKRALHEAGFTYLGALFLVALLGYLAAASAAVWETVQRREQERELLFVGNQFREAIRLYYERTPGTVKRYPSSLDDLLLDKRQLAPAHYLRRIYSDPITHRAEWGLVRAPDGGIMGVHSLSGQKAIKIAGFRARDFELEGKLKYKDWVFAFHPADARHSGIDAKRR